MRLAEALWLDLVGRARGDCWWLVAEVFQRRGVELVGFALERYDDWQEVQQPAPGDVVLFVRDGRSHVGIVLDEREYVHATDVGLVVVSRLASLRRAQVAYKLLRHAGVRTAPVAPATAEGVSVVYIPDPVGRPDVRQSWVRQAGTLGELAPPGANVVMTAKGPRTLAAVAHLPAGTSAVYATCPEGTEIVLAAIGLLLSVTSAIIGILSQPALPDARQDDPYSTFDGFRNTAASGIVQPVVYGTHKAAGNFISATQRVDADGRASFYGLILLSRGPVESVGGLTADADELVGPAIPDSIKLDDNPARNYQCSVSVRMGGSGQTTVPGFSETSTTESIGANLDQPSLPAAWPTSQAWARQTTLAVTGFDILLTYPGGLIGYSTGSSGGTYGVTMQYEVKWRVVGTATWTSELWSHTGHRNAVTNFQFSKRGLTLDKYEVSIRFSGAPGIAALNNTESVTASQVLAVNEIVAEGFAYPGCALLGVRLTGSDQLAGGVPTTTALVEGRKVWVYDGAGGFAQAHTRNPAWVALDVLTSKDYGLGRGGRITLDSVNIDEFDDFADWCDELVDDGRGGTVARAQCDLVADTERSGWDVAREIVEAAFGRLYYAGGKVRIWIDKATTASFMFTAGNTRDVRVSYLGKRDRYNAAEVQYVNAETDYQDDWATKLDDTDVLTGADAIRKHSYSAAGVTRAAQAYRLAQRLVNQSRYVKRRFAWIGGPESISVIPGQVAYLHGSALGVGSGGRILDATSSTVKLDRTITAAARVRLDVYAQDDTAPTVVYVNAGTYARNTAITIRDSGGTATTWSATPAAGSKWIIASLTDAGVAPVAVRVEKVSANEALDMSFEGSEYVAAVYSDDPGDVEEFTDTLPNPRAMPASVTGLRLADAALVSNDGSVGDAIRVAFTTVEAWHTGEVWYRLAGTPGWLHHGWSKGDALIPVGAGTYEVAVAARSALGTVQRVEDAATASITIRGRRAAPTAPTALTATVTAAGILHVTIAGPEGASYQLRYGTDWAGSVLIAERCGPSWSGACPFIGTQDVRVRTRSANGTVSESELTAPAAWVLAASVFTTDLDQDEGSWPGTLVDLSARGTTLEIDSGQLTGVYTVELTGPANTTDPQQYVITALCGLASTTMLTQEATRSVGSAWALATVLSAVYLDGRDLAEHTTVANAMYEIDSMPGNVYTVAGPPDIVAALTPVIAYDIDEALSWPTYETPFILGSIATLAVSVTLNRPHSRYVPELADLHLTSLLLTDAGGGGGGGVWDLGSVTTAVDGIFDFGSV